MTIAIYIAGLFPSPEMLPTKRIMRILGPTLIIAFYLLKLFVTFVFFTEIIPYYQSTGYTSYFTISNSILGLCILYCLTYNYTKCILTGPGNPEAEHEPKCKKCLKNKPLRAHHCSICDRCVLKMDHHCPWINNCLGLRNHCYFLLFLFYLDIGCFFFTGLAAPVAYYGYRNGFIMVSFAICSVFAVVIMMFAGWHWFLAVKGSTTIEYFSTNLNFSSGNWRKNLLVVFGTNDFCKIFAPCNKVLMHDGIYWPDTMHGV